MKKFVLIVLSLVAVSFSLSAAADYKGKKVLFVDSYHEGYAWSDGITEGIKQGFGESGVELKIVRMDTKRNGDVAFKEQAALKAKAVIEEFKPDVVIAADDNASKFLVMPYFKNAALPFIFCGVNWDASVYGYPYKNTTGMIEVTPIPQLIEQLQPFAKGSKIGTITVDILTERKEVENWEKAFGIKAEAIFAKNFEEWKQGFKQIQDKADIIIIGSDGGLYEGKESEMKAFAEANTKKPTGSSYDFMSNYAMISFAKVAQEQGRWSAEAALKILSGTSPADIPLVKNQEGQIIINTRIATSLGAEIPFELIETAAKIIE